MRDIGKEGGKDSNPTHNLVTIRQRPEVSELRGRGTTGPGELWTLRPDRLTPFNRATPVYL